jgi:Na+/proline symporter
MIAAIMSTADSVLLTLSSILAKDLLGKSVLRGASDARLTQAGKLASWVVVGALLVVALVPRITLWGLTELKMELLPVTPYARPWGLHDGTVGWLVNLGVCVGLSRLSPAPGRAIVAARPAAAHLVLL